MTQTPFAEGVLDRIRDLVADLPSRLPTVLRVGPGVITELNGGKPVTRPLIEPPLPFGVDIIEDAGYEPGQWRIFDQCGDEISSGVVPVPGATVLVQVDGGGTKRMRVLTVCRDDAGRIVDYWAADPDLFDMPFSPDWPNRRPW